MARGKRSERRPTELSAAELHSVLTGSRNEMDAVPLVDNEVDQSATVAVPVEDVVRERVIRSSAYRRQVGDPGPPVRLPDGVSMMDVVSVERVSDEWVEVWYWEWEVRSADEEVER